MTRMKRKLTLLLMCLLLLGGAAMASSEEVETDASEEISMETESSSEETPDDTDPSARDYINYYLTPGDSPYLEIAEAAEYIYTTMGESNYEQIVFSAIIEHHIIPAIGAIKRKQLSSIHIQRMYNDLKKNGRMQRGAKQNDKLLSNAFVRRVHAVLQAALKQAVKERLIPYIPCENCRTPPKDKKAMTILPPEKIGASWNRLRQHLPQSLPNRRSRAGVR